MASKTIINNSSGSISYNDVTITPAPTPSGAGETIYVNSSGTGYISQAVSPTFKNRIINGDMTIAQRGAAAVNTTNSYPVDRWLINYSSSATFSAQQSSDAPAGFSYSLATTVSSSSLIASTNYAQLIQVIEGTNIVDFCLGTSQAKIITVSFWVKSSITGKYAVKLQNSGSRTYFSEYTINSANTWEKKSVTISLDTQGTWLTNSGVGINLCFILSLGSNYWGTSDTWSSSNWAGSSNQTQLQQTAGAIFKITGVQLEAGSVATPFEYRPQQLELSLCRRYYYRLTSTGYSNYTTFGRGMWTTTTNFRFYLKFPTPMRATPTVALTAATGFVVYDTASRTVSLISYYSIGYDGVLMTATTATATAGKAGVIQSNNSNSPFIEFTSEL